MQTTALHIVLNHLGTELQCDRGETRHLLTLLRRALADAVQVLTGSDAESIFQCSHKLHSELQSCGYGQLSDLAMRVELLAKRGSIDRAMIDELLARSASLSGEIDEWLGDNG